MQSDSKYSRSYQLFLSFLREFLKEDDLLKSLLEDQLQKALSDFRFELQQSGRFNNLLQENCLPKSFIFIPFDKWLKGQETLNEFYRVFTRDGFLRHRKGDRLKPDFIPVDSRTVKLVWIKSIPELIYTSHHLIHTFKAIPFEPNYPLLISDNYLVGKQQGETKPPKLTCVRTEYSQITKEVFKKKKIYNDIDNLLGEIFNSKKVD